VPTSIDGPTGQFAIDEIIRTEHANRRLAPDWQLSDAVRFGRRALVAAIKVAKSFERTPLDRYLEYWRGEAERAERAREALQALINYWKVNHEVRVMKDADFGLTVAHDVCAALAKQSSENVRTQGRNEGDRPKREFVLRLAVAWMLLTGRPPAGGKDTFLGFVDAAWLDAGFANEEDFTRSLQFAQKRLKKCPGLISSPKPAFSVWSKNGPPQKKLEGPSSLPSAYWP